MIITKFLFTYMILYIERKRSRNQLYQLDEYYKRMKKVIATAICVNKTRTFD